jgi:hypothetical protein
VLFLSVSLFCFCSFLCLSLSLSQTLSLVCLSHFLDISLTLVRALFLRLRISRAPVMGGCVASSNNSRKFKIPERKSRTSRNRAFKSLISSSIVCSCSRCVMPSADILLLCTRTSHQHSSFAWEIL